MKKTEKFYDYEGFVEKFKPKLTTDDCYTPDGVYEAVIGWLATKYDISCQQVIRPFWPGGDYTAVDYPEGCVVVDNPPFSILSEIRRWYIGKGIHYFLFAPQLTALSSCIPDTVVISGNDIVYQNGANVHTAFVSNLPCFSGYKILGDTRLRRAVIEAQRAALAKKRKQLPKYVFPENVITVSRIVKIVNCGEDVAVPDRETIHVRALDAMKEKRKSIYGCGLLCSDRVAAELRAAELRAATTYTLSPREQEMVRSMNVETS